LKSHAFYWQAKAGPLIQSLDKPTKTMSQLFLDIQQSKNKCVIDSFSVQKIHVGSLASLRFARLSPFRSLLLDTKYRKI